MTFGRCIFYYDSTRHELRPLNQPQFRSLQMILFYVNFICTVNIDSVFLVKQTDVSESVLFLETSLINGATTGR